MQFDERFLPSVAGGIAAGLVFYISLNSAAAGLFFFFLPLLPLFLVAFRHDLRAMAWAVLIASLVSLLMSGIGGMVMFLLIVALPGLLLAQGLLLWRVCEAGTSLGAELEWYPAGLALIRVIVYAAGLFLLVALHYSAQAGGMEAVIAAQMQKNMAQMPAEYAASFGQVADRLPSLIFAVSAWVMALIVYANAWLAHFILREYRSHPRASVGFHRFSPPWWMLALSILAAIASFQTSQQAAFIGRTLLIILMLPYALSGLVWVHEISRDWKGRPWLLGLIYLLIFVALWPIAILAGIGLWEQFRGLQREKPIS